MCERLSLSAATPFFADRQTAQGLGGVPRGRFRRATHARVSQFSEF